MSNSDRNPHHVTFEGETEKAFKVCPDGTEALELLAEWLEGQL